MEERALHATKTAGEKWRIPMMQSEGVNLSSLLLTSRWFSVMKHKHGSAVSYHGTQHLFASTIPTLALGCFSCPRGFHARSRSEQHDTLHHPGWGIFLEVSRSHVFVLRPQFGKCSNLLTWSEIWVLHDFAIWPAWPAGHIRKKKNPSKKIHKRFLSPSCSRTSLICCFLTVSQSVAQSVFNASQGVRDIGFLSWTPLTIFPPQVSCIKEGYIAWHTSLSSARRSL